MLWVCLVTAVGPAHPTAGDNECHSRQNCHETAEADGKPGAEVFGEITYFKVANWHEAHKNHHVEAHHPATKTVINRALDGGADG